MVAVHLPVLACIVFSFLAAMRESICAAQPSYKLKGDFVFISGCDNGQYYELDNGCNALNVESTSSDDDVSIGKVGPDVEGQYCCDDTCNLCTNYSSPKFITVHETNIILNASASQNFTLETMAYASIGKISREELYALQFEAEPSDGTVPTYYICAFDSECVSKNYSINKTSYALNIFRIDPNNPAFYITMEFIKHTDGKNVMDSGPKFYVRGNLHLYRLYFLYFTCYKYLRQFW